VHHLFYVMLGIISVPVLSISSKKKNLHLRYPEVRSSLTSSRSFMVSSFTYILYYFGYEGLYRGFLVFGLRHYTGNIIAVIVSMLFTALTHIQTPPSVLIGSVVTGLAFPYLVILSGSIWLVFFYHSFIGVTMDYLCIRANRTVQISQRDYRYLESYIRKQL